MRGTASVRGVTLQNGEEHGGRRRTGEKRKDASKGEENEGRESLEEWREVKRVKPKGVAASVREREREGKSKREKTGDKTKIQKDLTS